jgi:hypothetical protein
MIAEQTREYCRQRFVLSGWSAMSSGANLIQTSENIMLVYLLFALGLLGCLSFSLKRAY